MVWKTAGRTFVVTALGNVAKNSTNSNTQNHPGISPNRPTQLKLINMRIIFFSLILFLIACTGTPGTNPEQTLKALETETMRLHDEAMRDMAEMNRMGRAFKKEYAELDSLSPRRDSITRVLVLMRKAETDMEDWMRNFTVPEGKTQAEITAYLQQEKDKIAKNYADIKAALAQGKAIAK